MTIFDLLTLKFDLEGQMPRWQTSLSETLDHADTDCQLVTKNAIKS